MKLLVLSILVTLAIAPNEYKIREDLTGQWDELFVQFQSECVEETKVNEEDVKDLNKRGHYPNIPEFKCYLKCVCIRLNLLSEDGVINEEVIRKTFKGADLDIVEESIVLANKENDMCEKAYKLTIAGVSKAAIRYSSKKKNVESSA